MSLPIHTANKGQNEGETQASPRKGAGGKWGGLLEGLSRQERPHQAAEEYELSGPARPGLGSGQGLEPAGRFHRQGF